MKRRHTWDDDLLGTALILSLTAFLLSLVALSTRPATDTRRTGAGYTTSLLILASVSAVTLAVLGSVLS